MAQNQESFIYRLVVQLQDEGAFDEMSEEISMLTNVSQQARGKIGGMLDDMSSKLEKSEGDWTQLRQRIDDIDETESIDQLEQDLQEIRADLIRAAEAADGLSYEDGVRTAAQLEQQVQRVQKAQMSANASAENLGASVEGVGTSASNVTPKTNMMSQSLLQGAQDAQFGVIGVANNIQMMGEAMARAQSQGFTMGEVLKSSFRSLLFGPMAIGTAITAFTILAQNMDTVTGWARELGEAFGFAMGEASALDDVLDGMDETVNELTKVEDFLGNFEEVERGTKFFSLLKDEINAVRSENAEYRSALNQLNQQGLAPQLNFLDRTTKWLGMYTNEQIAAANATGTNLEKVNQLTKRERALEGALKAVGAESIREAKIRDRLSGLLDIQGDKLDEVTDLYMEQVEEQKEANNQLERERFLRDLAIEAMDDGLDKELERIEFRFKKRRHKITEERELTEEQEKQALSDLAKARRNAEAEALEDSLDRIDKQVGEIEDPGAFTTDEAERENMVWVPGQGLMDPNSAERAYDEMTKRTGDQARKALQRQREIAQQRFQAEERQLQFEREMGEGGFAKDIGPMNRFELRMLEKQQDLQKRRLKSRLEFLKNMRDTYEEGSDEYKTRQKKVELLQERLTGIEDRHQRKREMQQKEHLRRMVENMESTELGNAASNVALKIFDSFSTVHDRIKSDQEMTLKKQAQLYSSVGASVFSAAQNLASSIFQTWRENRQRELENQGKTQEEQRKILRKEGKKRFKLMKSLKLASAIASGLEAQIHAWTVGMSRGGPALAAAMSAASALKTGLLIKKISSLSIGDKISGSTGGGGGMPSGEFTQLNQSKNARRAGEFGSQMRSNRRNRQRQNENSMQSAAKDIKESARMIRNQEVKYDDRTAEDISQRGQQRRRSLNV